MFHPLWETDTITERFSYLFSLFTLCRSLVYCGIVANGVKICLSLDCLYFLLRLSMAPCLGTRNKCDTFPPLSALWKASQLLTLSVWLCPFHPDVPRVQSKQIILMVIQPRLEWALWDWSLLYEQTLRSSLCRHSQLTPVFTHSYFVLIWLINKVFAVQKHFTFIPDSVTGDKLSVRVKLHIIVFLASVLEQSATNAITKC